MTKTQLEKATAEILALKEQVEQLRSRAAEDMFIPLLRINREKRERITNEFSTPSLCAYFEGEASRPTGWEDSVIHAFKDPVIKSFMALSLFGPRGQETAIIQIMVDMRHVMTEISRNYRLILKDQMPPSVKQLLDFYDKDIIPKLEKILASVEGKKPQPALEGMEHIMPLPEDW